MIKDAILNPWPWYVVGPFIGLTVPLLYLVGNKSLGISKSFIHICSIALPKTKINFLKENNWRKEFWNILFVLGVGIGGYLGTHTLAQAPLRLLPESYYSLSGVVKLLLGGMLVGFGSRYAGGCTSGHAILGLSTLQKSSLIAVIGFFVGGLTAAGFSLLFTK